MTGGHPAAAGRRGVWSAPGRVNLIGEHTDYNGGFALPLALPQRTRVEAVTRVEPVVTARTSRGGEPVRFDVRTEPGEVSGWGAYVAGVVWALRSAGHTLPGVDLRIDSDVPEGAGLSSSAALECAVAVALAGLADLDLDRTALALLGQRAENEYVGAPTGAMDQLAAMHGRDGHVLLLDCRSLTVEPVPCDLEAAGLVLLVIDTRAPHRHADGEYAARRRACEDAAAELGVHSLRDVQDTDHAAVLGAIPDEITRRRVRHVLTENDRVLDTVALLRSGRPAEIGPLLTASHASLRYDYEVSSAELDVAVDAALSAGALGARMTGGGFGGSAIALIDDHRVEDVSAAVRDAFAACDLTEPVLFTALPSAGAGSEEH